MTYQNNIKTFSLAVMMLALTAGCRNEAVSENLTTSNLSNVSLVNDPIQLVDPGAFANNNESAASIAKRAEVERHETRSRLAYNAACGEFSISPNLYSALERAYQAEQVAIEDNVTGYTNYSRRLQAQILVLMDRFGEANAKLELVRSESDINLGNLEVLCYLKTGEELVAREKYNGKILRRNKNVSAEDLPDINTSAGFEAAVWLTLSVDIGGYSDKGYNYAIKAERLVPNNPLALWHVFAGMHRDTTLRSELKAKLEKILLYGHGLKKVAESYLKHRSYY